MKTAYRNGQPITDTTVLFQFMHEGQLRDVTVADVKEMGDYVNFLEDKLTEVTTKVLLLVALKNARGTKVH